MENKSRKALSLLPLPLPNPEINVDTPNRRQALEHGVPRTPSDHILGKGTYGTVIKAVYKGKHVAVKVLRGTHESRTEGMRNEANALHWRHANVIGVLKIDSTPEYGIVIMERFPGYCLQKVLDKIELPLLHRINIISDVLKGLIYCHSRNVLHLDVKPQNILISYATVSCKRKYICKLCDFGSSMQMDEDNSYSRGTVRYMSPEALKSEHLSPASDIYSLAVTMWELKTRQPPYSWIDCNDTVAYKVVKSHMRPDYATRVFQMCASENFVVRTASPFRTNINNNKVLNGANSAKLSRKHPLQDLEVNPMKKARRALEPNFQNLPKKVKISVTNDCGATLVDENLNIREPEDNLKSIFADTPKNVKISKTNELEYASLYRICWSSSPSDRMSANLLRYRLLAILDNVLS